MVQNAQLYALSTNTPWVDVADPGITHQGTRVNLMPNQQADQPLTADLARAEKTVWEAECQIYFSQQNVKRAVIDALNLAVPKPFRRVPGGNIGVTAFKITDNPRDILDRLRSLYGKPTPGEKRANDTRFNQGWDAGTETIEELFDRLEDCYTIAIVAKPPYTLEQMIDKGVIAIQETGLYQTALLEWNGFAEANQTWPELKSHFTEAYEIQLTTGAGQAGYHSMNSAEAADDDSFHSIQQSVANIQMANNANAHQINENLSVMTEESKQQRALITQLQQQVAMLAQSNPSQQPIFQPIQPAYTAPLPVAYNVQPPPPIPAYVPVQPPTQQGYAAGYQQSQYGGRGGRGRGRGGRNRGGRGRNYRNNGAYAPQPPTQYAQPAATYNGGNIPPPPTPAPSNNNRNKPTPQKYFNNWNMCCTCGWDVPIWHTSQSCPNKQSNPHHNDGVNRNNADQFAAAGWKVSMKGKHKNVLPINPQPNQA